ncbi:hypothetical protein Fleli_2621 [Bernardetia litoralis DSM 6794]|uniref:Outer membrane protein beta-barrel domain-containing protein n=1 Tax=Bernardetia litoralis (strain ATCC 23117 / DSM 6794 / NBRC 15988 / NCIMB 1366 / Fx l1 / Sio-4) TaxID=880071 RepID=I4ALZ8_BERLS|nr:hypothetical protein [Bernardetia litoralis]AFM04983.1 hypothetical protein Fleli_2621 [Bernardetia litoralis DSM 6794]
MKKVQIFVPFIFMLALVLFPKYSYSQENTETNSNQVYSDINLTAGIYDGGFSGALAFSRLHPVAFKKRFYIGYGVRFTSYSGTNGDYITAPADVSEGNLFTPQNEEKLDTLFLPNSQINSLNASIFLMYKVTPKFSVGFNIDAIGFSFGKDQESVFYSHSENIPATTSNASVTNFNVLLTGDYDIGSLNSEFYAQYDVSDKIGLRAGASFVFSEYTTDDKFAFDNDRFRKKSLGLMLGIAYKL